MKYNSRIKRLIALFLTVAVILPTVLINFGSITPVAESSDELNTVVSYDFEDGETHTEIVSGDATVSVVDKDIAGKVVNEMSYMTLDTYTNGATYKNYNKNASVNFITLGKENGIELEANTEYTVSFRFRMEARTTVDTNNAYHDTAYGLRAPVLQAYLDGTGSRQSNLKLVGENLNGSGFVYSHSIPLNQWFTYTATFTTDAAKNGDTWFSFLNYGGFKYSVAELTVTPKNGTAKVYQFDELKNIPALGERALAETYSGTPSKDTDKYPALDVSVTERTFSTKDKSYITLDTYTNGATYKNYNKNASVNFITLGKENGVELEANTEYTVSFRFRMEARTTVDTNNAYHDTAYGLRAPVLQAYLDGTGSRQSNLKLVGENLNGSGFVYSHSIPLNQWFTYTATFTTDAAKNGDTWFSFLNYGGFKYSIAELTVTPKNGTAKIYKMDKLKNIPSSGARDISETYSGTPSKATDKYPALSVNVTPSVVDNALKLERKTASADPMVSLVTDYEVKKNTKYIVEFDYYIDGDKEAGGNAFGFIREQDNTLSKSALFENSNAGVWKHASQTYDATDITSVTEAKKFFQFELLADNISIYIDNLKITECKPFDESEIPAVQILDFENNYSIVSSEFSVVGKDDLPKTVKDNGSDGYLLANGEGSSSAAKFQSLTGLELKSNTSYRISVDYYVEEAYSNDYHFAFGIDEKNIGIGTAPTPKSFSHTENSTGWKTKSFDIITGDVTHKNGFVTLWIYRDRKVYFDNIKVEETVNVSLSSADLTKGEVKGGGLYIAGEKVTVKAVPMEGCTFDGWYSEGVLVPNIGLEYTFNATQSFSWEARFSGTPKKRESFKQDFEDLKVGPLMEDVYEITEDAENAHSGKKALHILPTLIKGDGSSNRFVPLIENAGNNLKENTQYDVYAWVKMVDDKGSRITLSVVNSVKNPDNTYTDSIIKSFRKPTAEWYNAEEFDGDWMKIKLLTFSSADVKSETVRFHISKMNENNAPASIDEFYIDDIEVVEHKEFDESSIPNKQIVDFESDKIGKTEVFKQVGVDKLPSNITPNGSNGYLYADGSKVKSSGNPDKKSAASYDVAGLKFKSNTMYKVSMDYFVAEKYSGDYHCAIGYYADNLGNGEGGITAKFSHSETATGWKTMTFTIVTGNVKHNEKYIYIASYEGAQMYYDNVVVEEMVQINVTSADLSRGEVKGAGGYPAGAQVTIKAIPMNGCTFEGWYSGGVRVPDVGAEYTFKAEKSFTWEARFSGYPIKKSYFIQDFEDLETKALMENVFEIVNDPKNARSGKQSLHVLPTLIEGNGSSNRFVPLLDNVSNNLKNDTEYDVYMWVKLVKDNKSRTFFSIVDSVENPDMPDTYTDTIIKSYYKETKDWFKDETWGEAVKTDGEWKRIRICTLTLDDIHSEKIRFHISKMNALDRLPSIDEFYIDDIEIVEREIDYENMKYCDTVVDLFDNGNFEEKDVFWTNLPDGLEIVDAPKDAPEWQLKKMLKYTGLKSGVIYKKSVPVKEKYYYTLAAYIKVEKAGNFNLSLTSNKGDDGIRWAAGPKDLRFTANEVGDWKRVSMTVETVEGVNSLILQITGTTGEVHIDNLNLFPAKKGFTEDPVVYTQKALNVITVEGDGTTAQSNKVGGAEDKGVNKLLIALSAVALVAVLGVGGFFTVKSIKNRGKKNEK